MRYKKKKKNSRAKVHKSFLFFLFNVMEDKNGWFRKAAVIQLLTAVKCKKNFPTYNQFNLNNKI